MTRVSYDPGLVLARDSTLWPPFISNPPPPHIQTFIADNNNHPF